MLTGLHNAFTPIFEAPDEVWHYAYVRWVAGGRGLPPLTDDRSGAYQEAAQPPLYYLTAALIARNFDNGDILSTLWHNPGFGYQAPGTVPDNKNMLVHPREELWPCEGPVLALHFTRLASTFFGLWTVAAAYALGLETFTRRRWAVVTAAFVAFHPQFVLLSSVVNNDAAAAALATTALYFAARWIRRDVGWRGGAVAGFVTGLAVLTKTSVLLMVPVMAGALTVGALRRQRPGAARTHRGGDTPRLDGQQARRPLPSPRRLAPIVATLGIFAVIVLAVAGWWYLRNLRQVGDPLGLGHHTRTLWSREAPASLPVLISELPTLLRSFWAAYGWGHVTWPRVVYVLLWALALVPLSAALYTIVRYLVISFQPSARQRQPSPLRGTCPRSTDAPRGEQASRTSPLRGASPFSPLPGACPRFTDAPRGELEGGARAASVGLLALIWLAAIAAALARWMQQVEAPHGRLLFPAIGAWALLLAIGTRRLACARTSRRWQTALGRGLPRALLLLCAALATLAPGARILATFAPPRLRKPARIGGSCAQPVDIRYGDGARLLCAEIEPTRAQPGDLVTVEACWTTTAPLDADYTVFVHLLGPEGLRVGERHTYPGLGRFPTSLWPVGEAFCDTYRVEIAEWAETPIRYLVAVGLFDAAEGPGAGTETRVPAYGPDDQPLEPPIVGAVALTAEPSETTTIANVVTAAFAEPNAPTGSDASIRLTGYTAPEHARAGESLPVSLAWEAISAPQRDYSVFVHLWKPGDPEPLAQHDGQPRGGWYPTTVWAPGDQVPDTHVLALPPDLPTGRYPLWAGLYRLEDGTRLAAFGPEGRYPNDMVPLGELQIE